jgi:transcriptional regulator with XRE-family HTH domain
MMRLKELRKTKDITQEELAKQLQLSPSAIGMYETGRREPDFETLQRIADYFHVSTDYILGREEKRLPFAALPVVGNIIKMLAALSPAKQEQAASYIAFLAQDDKKA